MLNTSLPATIQPLITALCGVIGVDAVVLGGSRARGLHTDTSDVDIGVYYGAHTPLDLAQLQDVLQQADSTHRADVLAAPGSWGPWVNGGAWLDIAGTPVDVLLRDSLRVAQVVADGEAGVVTAHYQTGHPHAYLNIMYMGELAVSQMLWDDTGQIAHLKQRAEAYPEAMQRSLIEMFGFESRFACDLAQKTIPRNDMYYVTAQVIRSLSCLNQVICAQNRHYCINEKGAVALIERCRLRPTAYAQRTNDVLTMLPTHPQQSCLQLRALIDEVLTVQLD